MSTRPSPTLLSANQITTPFCSSLPIGKLKRGLFNAGLTNRNPWFKIVLIRQTGICSQVVTENNIDVYSDTMTEFIRKYIGDVVSTVTIKTNPKQKLWIDVSSCTKLKVQTIAFNHGKVTGNLVE
jgi:hypothetical protein